MADFDLPSEVSPAFEKLIQNLNPFLNSVSGALSGRLTLGNLAAELKTVTVTPPAAAWTAPDLLNSWVNYDAAAYNPAGYMIDPSGRVHLRGLIKNGTAASGTALFTLPSGYRPAYREVHAVHNSDGADREARVDVFTDGNVKIITGGNSYLSLDGISFQAVSCAAPKSFSGSGWPVKLAHSLPTTPQIVLVVRARDTGGNTNTAHAAGAVDWAPSADGKVAVRRVDGLSPSREYQLTFLMM